MVAGFSSEQMGGGGRGASDYARHVNVMPACHLFWHLLQGSVHAKVKGVGVTPSTPSMNPPLSPNAKSVPARMPHTKTSVILISVFRHDSTEFLVTDSLYSRVKEGSHRLSESLPSVPYLTVMAP